MSDRRIKAQELEENPPIETPEQQGEVIQENLEAETPEQLVSVESKSKNVVYCGPTIRKRGIQQYTTFKGGIPDYFDEYIKGFPTLKQLFIEVDKLGEFQQRLSDPASAEQAFFNAAKSYFEGGKQ